MSYAEILYKLTRKAPKGAVLPLLEKVLEAGMALSNLAYNGKQLEDVPARIRESMAASQRDWDTAMGELRRISRERLI